MTQKYQVKVSMKQAAIVETGIVLKQGDFGMQIEIEVLDFDATGTTPQIVFRKAQGAVESTTITVSGNKYTYTFVGTELDTPGKCFCDLKLKNSTTQRISTASFAFKVIADTLDGLNEHANSYSDTIGQIWQTLEDYSDDSEAWAKGTKGGTPVPSTDDQYHNNAKYYSELSDASADNSETSALNSEAWAVGTKNGTPVSSSDAQYHNNAKYYTDFAAATSNKVLSTKNVDPNFTDLNQFTVMGVYSLARTTAYENDPIGVNYRRTVIVIINQTNRVSAQIIFNRDNGKAFFRPYLDDGWGAWASYLDSEIADLETTIGLIENNITTLENSITAVNNKLEDVKVDIPKSMNTATGVQTTFLNQKHLINTGTNPVDLTPVAKNTMACSVLDVESGDTCIINANGGGASGLAWCFIDQNNEKLSPIALANTRYTNYELTAPEGAKKLIINTKTFDDISYVINNRSFIDNKIAKLNTLMTAQTKETTLSDEYEEISNKPSTSYIYIIPNLLRRALFANLRFYSANSGNITFYVITDLDGAQAKVIDTLTIAVHTGENNIMIPTYSYPEKVYIGFRGTDAFISYAEGGTNIPYRIAYSDYSGIGTYDILQGSTPVYFLVDLKMTSYRSTKTIIVDSSGNEGYADIADAFAAAEAYDTIYIKKGTYILPNGVSLNRDNIPLFIFGESREHCIIKSYDGRYNYSLLYMTAGCVQNLTLSCEYVEGVSNDISGQTNAQYAIHTEGETGIGKQLLLKDLILHSDFFMAYGCGTSPANRIIVDNCDMSTSVATGASQLDAGAMYFHDQGYIEQYDSRKSILEVINCRFRAKRQIAFGISHTPDRGNPIDIKCINNTFYSEVNGRNSCIWLRRDPFETTFTLNPMSWNNSADDLNAT